MNQVKKTGAVKTAPFNVDKLTEDQLELAVEKWCGVHPRYMWFRGASIDIDQYKLSMDGINWPGFVEKKFQPK